MKDDEIMTELRRIRTKIVDDCEARGEDAWDHLLKIQDKFKHMLSDRKPQQKIPEKLSKQGR